MQKRTMRRTLITVIMGFMVLTAIRALAIDAPVMTAEPKYTAGTTNTIAFTLPAEAVEVEVWQDSDSDPSNGGLQSWTCQDAPLPMQATFSGSTDTLFYYYMRCRDSAGNWSGWSNAVSSMQHSGGPTFSSIKPAPDSWSNLANSPAIDVTIKDPAGIDPSSITMTFDGVPVTASYNAMYGRLTYTPTVKPTSGTHTVAVIAGDAAAAPAGSSLQGNMSTFSWSFQVETVPPQSPTTLVVPPITMTTTPTLQWSGAGDSESGIGSYLVWLVFDRNEYGFKFLPCAVPADGDGPVSWTLPDYLMMSMDETFEVLVWSVDKAGNQSTPAITASMIVDVAPPNAPSQLSGPAGTFWEDTTPQFTWSGATDGNGIAGYEVTLTRSKDNSKSVYQLEFAPDPFVWTVPEALPDGRYSLSVAAIDKAGRKSSIPKGMGFTIDTAPPTTPTVTLPQATNGNPTYWPLGLSATDEGSGVNHYHVEIWSNGILVNSYGTDQTSQRPTEEGLYEFRAWAVDGAGRISTDCGTASVCYDKTAPTAPSVSVDSPQSLIPTLAISGSSDAGSGIVQYIIWWQGDPFYVESKEKALTWTLPQEKALDSTGVQNITVVAVDAAGNRSLGTAYSYTFINERPNYPELTAPYYTNSLTPTCSWITAMDPDLGAEPHPAVRYKVGLWQGETCIFAPVVVEGTSWTVPGGVLTSEGTYQFRVWSIDDTGRESRTYGGPGTFKIDLTPPPAPTSVTTPPLFYATSLNCKVEPPTNSGGQSLHYRLEVWQNGICINQATSETTTGIVWVIVQLASGQNEVRAYSVDYAGNSSAEYVSAQVLVDLEKPQDVGPITGPTRTNDPHPVFKWDAVSDTGGGGLVGYYVELVGYMGSYIERGGYIVPAATGEISWAIPQDKMLTDAYYEVTVQASDGAGNMSANHSVLGFYYDSTPPGSPELSISSIVTSRTPYLSWKAASDNLTAVAGYSVEIWHEGTRVWGPTRVTGLGAQPTEALPDDGTYEVRVWSIDGAGNVSSSCAAKSILVDTVRPAPPTQVEGPTFTDSATPSFVFTGGGDEGSGLSGYHIMIIGPAAYGTRSFDTTSAEWTLPGPLTTEGTYEIRVWSADRAGLQSENYASHSFIFNTQVPNLVGPIQGPSQTNNPRPAFSWSNVTDSAGDVRSYSVTIKLGEVVIAGPFAVPVSGNPVTWTVPEENALSQDGLYTVSVRCVNQLGKASPNPLSFEFTFDKTQPLAPSSVSAPAFTNSKTPTFEWKAGTDDLTGIAGYSAELWHKGLCVWGPVRVAGQSVAVDDSLAISEDGSYEIRVRSIDGVGNASATYTSAAFTADFTPPDYPEKVDGPPEASTNRTPSFSWSESSDSGSGLEGYYVEFFWNRFTLVQAFSTTATTWSIPDPLPDGEYTLRVWAVDRAGNRSPGNFRYVLDTVGPVMSGPIQGKTQTNSSRPTFSWPAGDDGGPSSGLDHYEVLIKDGDKTVRGPLIVTPLPGLTAVSWTVPEESALSMDGVYRVVVEAVDHLGNRSPEPITLEFTFDSTPPGLPTLNLPYATNVREPLISWQAADDNLTGTAYLVELWANGVRKWGPLETKGTSVLLSDLAALAGEGQYELRVWSIDGLGNTTETYAVGKFIFDTTAPSVPVDVLVPGYTNDTTPSFTCMGVVDAGSGVAEYIVEVVREGQEVIQTFRTMEAQFSIPTALPSDGQYHVKVCTVDRAGNKSQWYTSCAFTLDTAAPVLNGPIQGLSFTNNANPTFCWTRATDAGTGLDHYVITINQGQTIVGGPFIESGQSDPISWTIPAEAALRQEGIYSIAVVAVDRAGNESPNSISFEFTVDKTPLGPPALSLPMFVNTLTPTFSWQPVSDNAAVAYTVELWHDGTRIWGPERATGESATPTIPSQDGSYELRVWSIDAAGNASATYSSGAFTLDMTHPEPPFTVNGPARTNSRTPSFVCSGASDGGSGLSGYYAEVRKETGTLVQAFQKADSQWAVPTAIAGDGRYELRVWSLDKAGNKSLTFTSVFFVIDTASPAAPSKVEGPVYANTGAPTFTCSDPTDNDFGGYSVEVHKQSGELVQSFQTTESRWAIPTALTQEGQYEVRVWSVDLTGNKSATYASASFVFDTTAPNPPSAVEGPAYTNIGGPFVSTGAVDNGSGIGGYYIEVHKQSGELVQSFEAAGSQWTIPTSLVQNGQYEVRVWANDKAGNRSTTYASFSFLLDTVAPAMTGSLQGPVATNNRRPTFSWPAGSDDASGVDHYAVTITLGGTVIHRLTAPVANGPVTWTIPQENALSVDGVYSIRVECIDRAGNSSQGLTLTFRLITVGPMVTILSPASGGTYTINESSSLWARASECASAQIRVDGGEWTDVTKVMADGSIFHFFAAPLAPGVHAIELKVRDSVGNETTVSITITVSGQRKGFGFGRFSFPSSGQ